MATLSIVLGLFVTIVGCELYYPDAQPPFELFNQLPEQAPLVDADLTFPQEQNQEEKAPSNELYVPAEIGQASGVAINNKSQLVIFHRAGRVWDEFSFNEKTNVFNKNLEAIPNATITVIDPKTGQLIGEYGRGLFYMPHGLSVDAEGNYWVTDVGRHQVIKLDKNFKPSLVLGEKLVPGDDKQHFCKPTDVAVASTGEIFVADGYCNGRIVKFNADGKFIGSFGNMNSDEAEPKNGEFFIPHSITLIEDLNLLCVADRENQRLQCFTAGLSPKGAHQRFVSPMGNFVTKAEKIGKLMAIREKHHYLVGLTNVDPASGNDFQVFIMDVNTGKANTFAKGIPDAHALALSEDGEVYVSQLSPAQVLKFSIPQQQTELNGKAAEDQLGAMQ